MVLEMPLRKANIGQKPILLRAKNMVQKNPPSIKYVKTSSFMLLFKKVFYFICKYKRIQIITTFLLSILSFDSLIATIIFLIIIVILSSRSSYSNLVFQRIFSYTSREDPNRKSTFKSFFRLSPLSEI